MTLLVIFGSTPDLAWQELSTLFPYAKRISDHVAAIGDASIDSTDLIERLGGATKIARLTRVVSSVDTVTLVPILAMENFRTFGISTLDTPSVSVSVLSQIKEILSDQGKSVRYITTQGQLSSVVIAKEHVCEFVIFPYLRKFGVGVTLAVQPFEEWARRDRGRPHADPRAGMLPPKVARIMVNIADSPPSRSQSPPGRWPKDSFQVKKVLLDPFCGMGTIPAEALLTGWNVIGSDQSGEAIKKAEANLMWLSPSQKRWKLLVSDATHISEKIEPASIDAIVTEPFLGKPNFSDTNVRDVVTGLEKLYIGCFKDWRHVLKGNAKVVIVFPQFVVRGKTYVVKKAIDSCETLGYTVLAGPIEYARPNAVVRREIFVLQKK